MPNRRALAIYVRSDLDWKNEGWPEGLDTGFILFKLPVGKRQGP